METLSFLSPSGVTLAADLYVPPGDFPAGGHPVVVVCLGWGSVKELMPQWGKALTSLDYAVLVPDYRGFGASGGERGRCFPDEHVDDIRAVMGYVAERPGLDAGRIALLGVSYGGAVAVAAGVDGRCRTVISVVGYGSGERHLAAIRTAGQWKEFRRRLAEDRHRRMDGAPSETVDPDEILLRDSEAREWRKRVECEHPHMAFQTTLESAERIVDFRPERHLPYSPSKPAMFIHAGADTMIPVEESELMWRRSEEPKRLVVVPGIGHHEVHHGEGFRQVIEQVEDWLGRYLTGVPDGC